MRQSLGIRVASQTGIAVVRRTFPAISACCFVSADSVMRFCPHKGQPVMPGYHIKVLHMSKLAWSTQQATAGSQQSKANTAYRCRTLGWAFLSTCHLPDASGSLKAAPLLALSAFSLQGSQQPRQWQTGSLSYAMEAPGQPCPPCFAASHALRQRVYMAG